MTKEIEEIQSVIARLKRRGEYEALLVEADEIQRTSAPLVRMIAQSDELSDGQVEALVAELKPVRGLGPEATRTEIGEALAEKADRTPTRAPQRRRTRR